MTLSIDHSSWSLADQGRHFYEQGFLILRGTFTGALLDDLRTRANNIRERACEEAASGIRYWYGGSTKRKNLPADVDHMRYSWGVNEITRPEWFDPALINALAVDSLDQTLNTILEEPRAWGQKLLWAPKDSHYDLNWHRDIDDWLDPVMPFKPKRNDHMQFNAALEPDNSFIVVPGSHRRAMLPAEADSIRQQRCCELPGQIRVELEPGDIVIMNAHAIHRGEAKPGAPRLSLHYSCQAQWVPLKPWGSAEDFSFITSDAFIEQLHPTAKPYYTRLREAKRTTELYRYLVDDAHAAGWQGELVDPVRQRRPA